MSDSKVSDERLEALIEQWEGHEQEAKECGGPEVQLLELSALRELLALRAQNRELVEALRELADEFYEHAEYRNEQYPAYHNARTALAKAEAQEGK